MFPAGKATLESLMATAEKVDFAALVLSCDDKTESKGQKMNSPRDNVLFELGLFMGRLGRERTFAVCNGDDSIKLPSDLNGVTMVTYRNRSDNNLPAQVSVACTTIRSAVDTLGQARNPVEINPRYDSDLLKLDGKWKILDVVNPKTVVIVVGDGIMSELLDRPVAGLLRDEIGRRGGGDFFKRAVIIGHSRWTTEVSLHANPTIAIGGEPANKLSGEILRARQAAGKDKFEEGPGGWGAFAKAIPACPASATSSAVAPLGPRIALWGDKAAETRTAVEQYIQRPLGLQHFLDDHARWKTA
jgi:hypothetical protein